ncbi:MAG: hypothetical protein WCS15_04360 [Prevotella sp.]
MRIIRIEPNQGESYPSPQTVLRNDVPSGYAQIDESVDLTQFYASGGFVALTLTDGVVTGYTADPAAWAAWQAANTPDDQEPTTEDRMAALEAAVLEIALGG